MAEVFSLDMAQDCEPVDVDPTANIAASEVSDKHICDACGLHGHTASFWHDGVKYECAAKVMQRIHSKNGASKGTLMQSDKYKNMSKEYAKQISELSKQMEDMETAHSAEKQKFDRFKKKYGKKPAVRSAISEEEISMTEDSAMEATTNEDDDDSSDGSVVHSFVNAASTRNMRKKYK